ncbi:MAG: transposase [Sphingomonas sp.]
MPRLIQPDEGSPIELDELVATLDASPADMADENALAELGRLLGRLARNRDFLADHAIDALKDRYRDGTTNGGYGAQVLLLRPPNGRYLLRANFWPALDDAVVRASGTAPFFYDHAHDHNFSFLTVGYLGPGYWSDYYDYDAGQVVGVPGEAVALRFVERARLSPGKLLLYRAHRDVHVQLPPDAFSVSLNILAVDPAQKWRDQFRFDIAAGTIAEALTVTAAEAVVALAVHFGGEDGLDLVEDFASRHPSARMRVTALGALASSLPEPSARAALFERGAQDRNPRVAAAAAQRLAMIAASIESSPERR